MQTKESSDTRAVIVGPTYFGLTISCVGFVFLLVTTLFDAMEWRAKLWFCAAVFLLMGYFIRIFGFTYKLSVTGIERRFLCWKKQFAWSDFVDICISKLPCGEGRDCHMVEVVVFSTQKRIPRVRPCTGGYVFSNNKYISFALNSETYPLKFEDKFGRHLNRSDLYRLIEMCDLKVIGYPNSPDFETVKWLEYS